MSVLADGRVLYRVWRPLRFAEVVGQEHVTRALQNAFRRGRLAHAYIFSGPRGTGKTSVARIVARLVNCAAPVDGEPCGQCDACERIPRGTFPDVLELDAASNRGIDEVRSLRDQARYAPIDGRMKVYIVDEVHMLTSEAANALLKTLEEPPPRLMFLLCTTDPQRLPPTVLSRCQRFEMRRIPDPALADHLRRVAAAEGLTLEPEAAARLARLAQGGLRDGLSLLEQCAAFADGTVTDGVVLEAVGGVREEALTRLAEALGRSDGGACLTWAQEQAAAGVDPRLLAAALRDQWYAWLKAAAGVNPSPVPLPAGWGLRRIAAGLDRWVVAAREARSAEEPQIVVEVALAELAIAEEGSDARLAELEVRVRRLEEGGPAAARPVPPRAGSAVGARAVGTGPVTGNKWDTVLQQLHRRRATNTEAYLSVARPVIMTEDEVRVRFPRQYALHREQVLRPEHRGVIEEVLAEVVGGHPRLRADLEEEIGGTSA